MVERQLIELDIAGIDEASGRSLHEHSQSVRNGMRDVHKLKIERTDLQLVASLDLNQSRIDAMLLALGFNESNVSLEPISGISGRSFSRYGTPPI